MVSNTWSEKSAKNGEEMQKNVTMKQLVWRNKFAKSNGVKESFGRERDLEPVWIRQQLSEKILQIVVGM